MAALAPNSGSTARKRLIASVFLTATAAAGLNPGSALLLWKPLIASVFLTATSAAQDPPAWNPVTASDRISSYFFPNREQCRRLCWYMSVCARSSYRPDHSHTMAPLYSSGGGGGGAGNAAADNCVLHASVGQGLQLPEGWVEEQASGQSLPPSHGCATRHCRDTEVCIPVVSGDTRSVCASLPDINDCASIPCANGGSCVDQVNNYTCNCAAGYTGRDCQTDINDCASIPCANGGSCVDQVNNYTCNCAAGYTGRHCQTDINDCASIPCANGGSCVDQVNNYTCNCAAGYTGSDCQTDINDCASIPCVNGGSCVDQVNNYTCNCTAGYTGRHCQTENWLGLDCGDGSGCVWGKTACFSGHCLCDGGFFFSHSQYACVENCVTFHPTYFVKYTDWDFGGHDAFHNTSDFNQCQASCSALPACRMFVHYITACYIKLVTPQEYPGSWTPRGTGSGIHTHQKTCV